MKPNPKLTWTKVPYRGTFNWVGSDRGISYVIEKRDGKFRVFEQITFVVVTKTARTLRAAQKLAQEDYDRTYSDLPV